MPKKPQKFHMTVADLAKILNQMVHDGDGRLRIALARDPEGNGFSYMPYENSLGTDTGGALDEDVVVFWPE